MASFSSQQSPEFAQTEAKGDGAKERMGGGGTEGGYEQGAVKALVLVRMCLGRRTRSLLQSHIMIHII